MNVNLNEYKLWTALISPLDEKGNISEADLRNLLSEQEAAGNGIVILGSTGESLNLGLRAKKRVIEIASEMKLNVPLLVGAGGHDIEDTIDWLIYLETKPIHGYLMVTPIYAKPGEEGQLGWFSALMDAVTKPCMLYNVPGRTGCVLNTSALTRLSTHQNFWAVKESGGSTESFIRYKNAIARGYVYCGDDPLLPDYVPHGAIGLISVAANVWPMETMAYVTFALANELNQRDIFLWQNAGNALFTASNPVPVKALLAAEGRITTPVVRPPLSHRDVRDVQSLINTSQMVRNWFEQCRISGRLESIKTKLLDKAS